jgi:SSU ribosomal protein S1P
MEEQKQKSLGEQTVEESTTGTDPEVVEGPLNGSEEKQPEVASDGQSGTESAETMENITVDRYSVGDKITGTVSKVEDKQVFVRLDGTKLDGIIPISELSALHIEKAGDAVKEGEQLELEIIRMEEDALILSKRRVDAERAWKELEEKMKKNEPVEAEVKDIVKGGLVVDLGVRGFVPASLVEDHYVEDFSDYKGKTLAFKIVELNPENNRLILSHKDVVLEEKAKKRKEILSNLKAGEILEGTVQRVTNFGVFVDIGGVDGLVHISQISHQHIDHPSEAVQVGETVKVKVLSVDPEKERISLSIKETLPGPWEHVSDKIHAGDVIEGTVKRLVSFGAFVEVLPGVEGLVHISQLSTKHVKTPQEVLKEGETVKVKVLNVNEAEKRISLSMKEIEQSEGEEDSYPFPEQSRGFQLGEMVGDQLKKLQ